VPMALTTTSYQQWLEQNAERFEPGDVPVNTASGIPVRPVYTPLDVSDQPGQDELARYERKLGLPGEPPFTRGIDPAMYRHRPWVMGMYSGQASPKATNQRIRSLLEAGQSGFSIALDLPTQLGLDSDHPLSRGEVGRVGVPIDSLTDMVELLDGVPLDKVAQIRTTANSIGPLAVALFVNAARVHGYSPESFKVMLQNDVLKEYAARHTHIFPSRHGRDFSVDVIEYCARNLPHWEPIEFCGYHIRDAGANAVQEVAIAISNGIEYIDCTLGRGLDIETFAHSLYLFLSAGLDIFEEVAKFRAARRIWADVMRERFGATERASQAVNIFCYTLGGMQTAAEPLNNLVRIAYQALAAALGGVQTLASSSYDEALGIPSPEAAHLGLRTQQILALETGVTRSADPLGGSYLVEALTDQLEGEIRAYMATIEERGGALGALESGFLEAEIEEQAFRYQQRIDRGELPVVSVNCHQAASPPGGRAGQQVRTDLDAVEAEQVERLQRLRAERDQPAVLRCLEQVRAAATSGANTIPAIIDAVGAEATVGEICQALADVWGRAGDRQL
jgi:methylmalonyl-CoA mutase N-terminal domain/subunit